MTSPILIIEKLQPTAGLTPTWVYNRVWHANHPGNGLNLSVEVGAYEAMSEADAWLAVMRAGIRTTIDKEFLLHWWIDSDAS